MRLWAGGLQVRRIVVSVNIIPGLGTWLETNHDEVGASLLGPKLLGSGS